MSFNRIVRQLRREATGSPKKAAVLGLSAVVALWFWVPLVWGWISPEDTETEIAAATPVAEASSALPVATAPGPAVTPQQVQRPRHTWQQLVRWMDNDPRTLAANFAAGVRDPFATPPSQLAVVEPEDLPEDEPEEVRPDVTPENLGMVLSSTIVGPRRRVARIDGVLYRPKDTVKLDRDGQQIEFKLAEIHPRRVVLDRDGNRFELKALKKTAPAHSGRIERYRETN